MSESATMGLDEVIDGQRLGRAAILMLILMTLAMLSDGFDIAAIGYVGPELVKQWQVTPQQLSPMLSAGIVGLLVGAPLLGFGGDRIGRKTAIVVGLAIVGSMSLVTMAATSLQHFVVLRFLTGVGLGGVIPNVIALTAEASPRRLRGRFIVFVNFGVPAGIAIPGLVAAVLVPQFGWQAIMLIGGLLPLAVAIVIWVALPESLKYLAQRGGHEAEVLRRVRDSRPDLAVAPDTRFSAGRSGEEAAIGSQKDLFKGSLGSITPLLWLALATNQMANFFSLSWLPTLLQSMGASTATAGLRGSLFSIGGLAGGILLTFLVDRFGVVPMVALFLLGVPLVAAIGIPDLPSFWFAAVIAGAGFCVTGINFSMSATLGSIYPTPVRSLGTGWAQAVGRLGSLAAPLIGGALLGLQLPTRELLYAPAVSLAIGAVACMFLAVLCLRRFGGTRLMESAAASEPVLAPTMETRNA